MRNERCVIIFAANHTCFVQIGPAFVSAQIYVDGDDNASRMAEQKDFHMLMLYRDSSR